MGEKSREVVDQDGVRSRHCEEGLGKSLPARGQVNNCNRCPWVWPWEVAVTWAALFQGTVEGKSGCRGRGCRSRGGQGGSALWRGRRTAVRCGSDPAGPVRPLCPQPSPLPLVSCASSAFSLHLSSSASTRLCSVLFCCLFGARVSPSHPEPLRSQTSPLVSPPGLSSGLSPWPLPLASPLASLPECGLDDK